MGDVIEFPRSTQAVSFKGYRTHCLCRTVHIDHERRQLSCSKCGKVLDPYDLVLQFFDKHRTLVDVREHLKTERAELDEVARRVRNAKAQVRRWEARADDATPAPDNVIEARRA